MPNSGYAGEILVVDLSQQKMFRIPSDPYTSCCIGGRGVAAKLYWDMVPADTGTYGPQNCLVFATGPVAGFPGFAGYRWQICGKSVTGDQENFSYANLSGKWGARLKFAGYDALVVLGIADRPVYLYISTDSVEIRGAGQLWGRTSFDAADMLKAELGDAVSVLTIGPAAENLIPFSTVITCDGASGSAGFGSVMGAKHLKAVVVTGDRKPKAADPQVLGDLRRRIKSMKKKPFVLENPWVVDGFTKPNVCFGCGIGCSRQSYILDNGRRYKSFCQAACFYMQAKEGRKPALDETALLASRLCDAYGLDASALMGLSRWLGACYQNGVLTEKETGLPLSKYGSIEFIQTLMRRITNREGFGELLAQGIVGAGKKLGSKAEKLQSIFIATPAGDTKDYDPRLIPTTALLYATEPRRPIQQLHEPAFVLMMWLKWMRGDPDGFYSSDDFMLTAKRFWGSAAAADFTTYEGKALAAKMIQDRTYAKESLILCDFLWPMTWADYEGGHVGDPTLESQIFSAITGRELDEPGLNRVGERIFNLQRAILLRQGWPGRRADRLLDYLHEQPLDEGEIYYTFECEVMDGKGRAVSKKGNVVRRDDFERLKDEYYLLRGWDEAGLPTVKVLKELDLGDVADNLIKQGVIR